jgi:carbonic anhydrase/acetyltransferase-like protein (isoleucine patch superfamily)
MNRSGHRRRKGFVPQTVAMEGRFLLSTIPSLTPRQLAHDPPGFPAVRPNTPVLPYGRANRQATFIDTTAHILNGGHVYIGYQTYVGPYANLNATSGFIKIGNASFIGNNTAIVSDPQIRATNPTTSIVIGDNVLISYNATVYGPSQIGAFGAGFNKATEIGPGALVDGAIISPGAIVGALARVGPGVTVPGNIEVKPGANVTTDAEASNPALGKVEPIVAADQSNLGKMLANSKSLALGYATLYQGQAATGVTPGVATATASAGPFNGNLANVEGANLEPSSASVSIAPSVPTSPFFPTPKGHLIQAQLPAFPARVTGGAVFHQRAHQVAKHLGRGNSIAADLGQPIVFGSISQTGRGVTITSPLGGNLNIGQAFQAQAGAVLLGDDSTTYTIGDNVTLGANSVVNQSNLGSGTVIGSHAYVSGSTLPPNSVVPDNAIIINNKPAGTVQW